MALVGVGVGVDGVCGATGHAAATYPLTLSHSTTFYLDLTAYQGVMLPQEQGEPVLVGERGLRD